MWSVFAEKLKFLKTIVTMRKEVTALFLDFQTISGWMNQK